MLTELLSGAVLLALALLYLTRGRRHKNCPPGPKGWPIIGTLPRKGQTTHIFFNELREKYGDLFSVQMGGWLVVGIMRYDLIKEAMALPGLQDRPDMYTMRMSTKFTNTGLVFSSGAPWENGRRFALRHLRNMGLGRSVMETVIQQEAEALCDDFAKQVEQPVQVSSSVNVAVLNIIWQMVAGERFDVTNKGIQNLSDMVEENMKLVLGPLRNLDWFPWLSKLPDSLQNYLFQTHRARDNFRFLDEFLQRVIAQHQATLDPDNVRDYIDHYLLEMAGQHKSQDKDPETVSTFEMTDLTTSILDLYAAGSETTSSTLRWLLLYMAVHQRVQLKAQQELDAIVPQDRLPQLQDKLPYFQAVLAELHRCVSFAFFTIPHCAREDTLLAGYIIPKGAMILPHLVHCHYDPKLWDNPTEFRPERFLDSEGNFVSREGLVAFGTGRRQCLGESLARMELLLMGATIVRRFSITVLEGEKLTVEQDLNQESVFNFCEPFSVIMKERHVQ